MRVLSFVVCHDIVYILTSHASDYLITTNVIGDSINFAGDVILFVVGLTKP